MKRALSIILAAVMLLLLLAGCCDSSNSAETEKTEDETVNTAAEQDISSESEDNGTSRDDLVVALTSEPVSLDINRHSEGSAPIVCAQIAEGLVKYGDNNEIECVLAESYEYVDDTTIKFYLHQGVLFHNGEEMKASDVLYTFYRVSQDTEVQATCAAIDFDNCYCEDDYTFVLKLKEPYAPILSILTLSYFSVCSEAYVEEVGEDQMDFLPCGTGPYKFVSWDQGNSIVLERFDDYWNADKAAKTSKITFRFITESASRTIELETGGVDIALGIAASDMEMLSDNENITVYAGSSLGYTLLIFGDQNPALKDVNVRLALMKALDRESIAKIVMSDYAEVCNSVIGIGSYGYTDEWAAENWDYDLDAAKALLEEAGVGDLSLDIMITDSTTNQTIAEMVKNMWEAVGVSVSISVYESGTYYDYFGAGEFDTVIATWDTAVVDPDDTFTVLFSADGMGFYVDDTSTELINAQRYEIDEDTRLQLIKEVQIYIQEKVGVLPLYCGSILSAYNASLTNMPPAGIMQTNPRLADVEWTN